ncbi:hypothetical protein [Streptomyces sp. NPDC058304]|uniref:hypothetical protein n=1 Tax=Streptomyces sp. NPDC058304 TaxID=3346437 RepID=UPI0036E4D5BD
MRLRPTAAALLGALALVLPTAGPSMAGGNDDLGRLEYIIDNDGRAQIRPSDNDTCYELTDTSNNRPATAVHNDTDSRAVLYPNHGCNGRVERELQPGDTVHNVAVLSATFVPVHGRRDDFRDDRDDFRDDFRNNDDDFRSHRTPMDEPEQKPEQKQEQKQEHGQEQEHGQDQQQGQDQGQEHGQDQQQGQDQGQEHGQDEGQEHGQDEGKEHGQDEGKEHRQDEGKEHGQEQGRHEGGHKQHGKHDLFDFIFKGIGG